MTITKTKGIIISDTNYSESSKILNVLTEDFGKISVIAKGCRNIKSKLRSTTSKLTYGTFHINYKEDAISTLIEVDILNEFVNIKKSLEKIGYASYLLDLTNQVLKESNDQEIFKILESSLIKINDNFDSGIITNIAELKYLKFLGVLPVLDHCSICGSTKDIITINGDSGGYVCKNCYTNEYITDEKTIKLVRMFYYVDISKIKELNIQDKNKKEINQFLESYYSRYTGLYLKSKDFLKQIKWVKTHFYYDKKTVK